VLLDAGSVQDGLYQAGLLPVNRGFFCVRSFLFYGRPNLKAVEFELASAPCGG